jgi:hypothetical protein
MTQLNRLTWQAAAAGRWIARIGGALMVLFLLAFVFGEGPPRFGKMTTRENLLALGMGSLFLGLIVAWFREGWGGLLSVLGWGFFGLVEKRPMWDWPLSIPAAMGLLHLVCWWRLRGPAPPAEPVSPAARVHRKMLYAAVLAVLTVFVLLCANEMLGQPPLMTAAGRPPAEAVGTWTAEVTKVSREPLPGGIPVELTVHADGSVSGTIGGKQLTSGRLMQNRSWFGRMMNWRTEYLIRGTLAGAVESYGGAGGDRFSAPRRPPRRVARIALPLPPWGAETTRTEPQEVVKRVVYAGRRLSSGR